MDTKLTLKLDRHIIEQAKAYAKANNLSLSKLIENYLSAITTKPLDRAETSPLVKSLTGVIDLKDENPKQSYTDYLAQKYS